MIKSCDSGSLPFVGDSKKFLDGANRFSLSQKDESNEYFKNCVVESFLDKLRVGIDVPNYPQFRDMNEMFLSMMDGVEKIKGGYLETGHLSLKAHIGQIPEVLAIKHSSQRIKEAIESSFEVRICVTGPYTLASFFPYRDEGTFLRLGNVISSIVEKNLFSSKYGRTSLVSVDEPLFGFVDDPSIDFGSKGRENLLSSWETIFYKVKSQNMQTMMHLHSTTNPLFWDVASLDIIDSHVDDPLIRTKKTKDLLESKDKFLKASLAVNEFDILIKEKIVENSKKDLSESDVNEKIAEVWKGIKDGSVDPELFLETGDMMKNRLARVIEQFGAERVVYAGPECGLKAYPTYENAFECLRRVSVVVQDFNAELSK